MLGFYKTRLGIFVKHVKNNQTRAWQGRGRSRPWWTGWGAPCHLVTPVITGMHNHHARDHRPWPPLRQIFSSPTAVTVIWWCCLAITASITAVMEEWFINHGRDSQSKRERSVQEWSRPLLMAVMNLEFMVTGVTGFLATPMFSFSKLKSVKPIRCYSTPKQVPIWYNIMPITRI